MDMRSILYKKFGVVLKRMTEVYCILKTEQKLV